jgi:hypothetical protein
MVLSVGASGSSPKSSVLNTFIFNFILSIPFLVVS